MSEKGIAGMRKGDRYAYLSYLEHLRYSVRGLEGLSVCQGRYEFSDRSLRCARIETTLRDYYVFPARSNNGFVAGVFPLPNSHLRFAYGYRVVAGLDPDNTDYMYVRETTEQFDFRSAVSVDDVLSRIMGQGYFSTYPRTNPYWKHITGIALASISDHLEKTEKEGDFGKYMGLIGED